MSDQIPLFEEEPKPLPHTCHIPECAVEVPSQMLMCRKHWFMVPANIRRRVWKHFNVAQCSDDPDRPRPTREWLDAADDAIKAVREAIRK